MKGTARGKAMQSTITANLYSNDGEEITSGQYAGVTVECFVVGGGNLNAAVPRLEDNDDIYIAKLHHPNVLPLS